MAHGTRWERDEQERGTRYGGRQGGDDWRRDHGGWREERSFGSQDRSEGYGRSRGGFGEGGYEPGDRYGQGYGGDRFGNEQQGGGYRGGAYGAGGYGGQQQYGSQYGDYAGGNDRSTGRYGGQGHGRSYYEEQGYGRGRGSERDRDVGFGAGGAYQQGYGGQRVESGGMFGGYEGNDGPAEHHRGRGPKNYARSDERIQEDVHDRLTDDPWLDASHIEVQVKDREVTLNGTVGSRRDKRRAEDLVDDCSGVKHVQNNLRVQEHIGDTSARQGSAGGTTSTTANRTSPTTSANATGTTTRPG